MMRFDTIGVYKLRRYGVARTPATHPKFRSRSYGIGSLACSPAPRRARLKCVCSEGGCLRRGDALATSFAAPRRRAPASIDPARQKPSKRRHKGERLVDHDVVM